MNRSIGAGNGRRLVDTRHLFGPTATGVDMRRRSATITMATMTGFVVLAAACGQTLPRRVPGSDLTLPESTDGNRVRSTVSRCSAADTVVGSRDPTSRCGRAVADTARSTSDPLVPSGQKTP